MSVEQAEAFLARVQADEEFAAQLEALREDPAAVRALIAQSGFDATPEEIKSAVLDEFGAVLTEEQLADIAGGLDHTVVLAVGVPLVVVAGAVTAAAI